MILYRLQETMDVVWKRIPGYEDFEASNEGDIRTVSQKKKLTISSNGIYLKDQFGNRRRHKIHIWIAKTFILNSDPINLTTVHHKDGNTDNNAIKNLEWSKRRLRSTLDLSVHDSSLQQPKRSEVLFSKSFRMTLCNLRQHAQGAFAKLVCSHGSCSSNGCIEANVAYKRISINSITVGIHFLSYFLFNDDIDLKDFQDQELVIRHKCGNNRCFEHTHLEAGTGSQNQYDDKLRDGTLYHGERHHNASISAEIARQIISSRVSKDDKNYMSVRERAKRFNVSEHLIMSIDAGHSWSHLRNASSSDVRLYKREKKRRARVRVWSIDMFETAVSRIKNRTQERVCPETHLLSCCQIWTGPLSSDGYGYLTIYGKYMAAHIVALESQLKRHRLQTEVTRHLCGVKSCCNPMHLQFGTRSENMIDIIRHGTARTNLSIEKVRDIKLALLQGISRPSLSAKYNCEADVIRRIDTGASWKHVLVDGWVPSQIRNKRGLTFEQAKQIKEELRAGCSRKEVAEHFGCSVDNVRCIDVGRTFKSA